MLPSVAQLVEQLTLNQSVDGAIPGVLLTNSQRRKSNSARTAGARSSRRISLCQRRARRAGHGGFLEISNPQSEIFGREPKVVVGYDRRFFLRPLRANHRRSFSPEMIFKSSSRRNRRPRRRFPSPSKTLRAVGGVMITASHNPPIFNGFKLKSHYGGSSDSETCQAVESFLDKNPVANRKLADAFAESGSDSNRRPPGALRRAEKARGFQAHREIKAAFRARRVVRRRRGLL